MSNITAFLFGPDGKGFGAFSLPAVPSVGHHIAPLLHSQDIRTRRTYVVKHVLWLVEQLQGSAVEIHCVPLETA